MANKKTEELKRKKSAIKATLADKAVKKSTKKKVDESKLKPIKNKTPKGLVPIETHPDALKKAMVEKATGGKITTPEKAKNAGRINNLVPIESTSDYKKRLMVEKYTNGKMTYTPYGTKKK